MKHISQTLKSFENSGGVPNRYDLLLEEMIFLYNLGSRYEAIAKAFEYGFIKGTRYEKNKKKGG